MYSVTNLWKFQIVSDCLVKEKIISTKEIIFKIISQNLLVIALYRQKYISKDVCCFINLMPSKFYVE